jgi:hypothetical protein
MQKITILRLSTSSVFKLIWWGFVCSMIPLALVAGLLAMFGAETLTWNDKPATGISGLILGPLIGLFVAGIFTAVIGAFISAGLWICSFIRPTTIAYYVLEDEQ